jgi:hypothetical protein
MCFLPAPQIPFSMSKSCGAKIEINRARPCPGKPFYICALWLNRGENAAANTHTKRVRAREREREAEKARERGKRGVSIPYQFGQLTFRPSSWNQLSGNFPISISVSREFKSGECWRCRQKKRRGKSLVETQPKLIALVVSASFTFLFCNCGAALLLINDNSAAFEPALFNNCKRAPGSNSVIVF